MTTPQVGADCSSTSGQDEASRPSVEIHLNLWRDIHSGTNALDVGLKLSDLKKARRFYLYVPGPIDRDQIRDLAPVLRIGSTLNAVFNDVVELGSEADESYEILIGGEERLRVFSLSEQDVFIEPFKEDESTIGSRLVFNEQLCARMKVSPTNACYVRIRIELIGPTADLFSSEIVTGDHFFASEIGRLELTELRLNERRNYPNRILELADRHDFKISVVHYFLIRDLRHRLVVQHAPFKKVRRLERDLWADYLAGDTSQRRFRLGRKLAERFVIYHWRAKAEGNNSLNNFIAFASFSASTPSLIKYALLIILLGALGSSLAAGLILPLDKIPSVSALISKFCSAGNTCESEASDLTLASVLLLFIVAIFALPPLIGLLISRIRQMRR